MFDELKSKFEELKNSLKDTRGLKAWFVVGFLFLAIIAFVLGLVGLVLGFIWAITAVIIYLGAGLVGYPVSYKMAYGAAKLLFTASGVFGGVRVVNKKGKY